MRRTTGLRRTSSLRRRVALRPMSDKRKAQMPERRALVQKVLTERPRCEFPGCGSFAADCHEPLSRARGGSILDEANTVALCREHHTWVHDHPAEATRLGLLVHSWDR